MLTPEQERAEALKWTEITEMAMRGDLCALTRLYPREAVTHFVALKEMALTCAPLPVAGCDPDGKLRSGKRSQVYNHDECSGNTTRVHKKQRTAETPLCVIDVDIIHSLLDNQRCDLCQTPGGLHTLVFFRYESDDDPDSDPDDNEVTACVSCARRFTARDTAWQSRDFWAETTQRRHAYDTYRLYGLIDDLGL